MDNALCCSKCDDVVLKSFESGEMKLRSKVVIFKDDKAVAICKGCGTEIPIPVAVDFTLMKSVVSSEKLRLYVKK